MNFQDRREAGSRMDKASSIRQNSRSSPDPTRTQALPFSLYAKPLLRRRVTYCGFVGERWGALSSLFKGGFPEWAELFLRVFKRMPPPQVHKGNGLVSAGKRPRLWLPSWAGIVWGLFENLPKWERSLLRDVKFQK